MRRGRAKSRAGQRRRINSPPRSPTAPRPTSLALGGRNETSARSLFPLCAKRDGEREAEKLDDLRRDRDGLDRLRGVVDRGDECDADRRVSSRWSATRAACTPELKPRTSVRRLRRSDIGSVGLRERAHGVAPRPLGISARYPHGTFACATSFPPSDGRDTPCAVAAPLLLAASGSSARSAVAGSAQATSARTSRNPASSALLLCRRTTRQPLFHTSKRRKRFKRSTARLVTPLLED